MATAADTPDKRIDQREGALLALANLFQSKQNWRTSGLPVQSVLDRDTEYKAFAAKFPGIKRDAVKRQHKKWLGFGRDALVNNASIDAETIATPSSTVSYPTHQFIQSSPTHFQISRSLI